MHVKLVGVSEDRKDNVDLVGCGVESDKYQVIKTVNVDMHQR